MRTSKRDQILAAAVDLIQNEGLEAVSYDSLARASGLSKSGIIYHFPSSQEIMRGIHQYLADEWEQDLIEAAGGPAETVNGADRLRAVVISLQRSATRADLLVQLDANNNPEFARIWQDVDQRWMPSVQNIETDAVARTHYLVQLLAEGLWVHDSVHNTTLTPAQRQTLTDQILSMIP